MNFANKKLLILGANAESIPLIDEANRLGIKTYVTDFMADSPGKKIAYKALNIDGQDLVGLAKVYEELKLDGVIVGVADRLVVPYAKLCEALKIPAYASADQAIALSNKEAFNDLLSHFGLNPIPHITLSDVADLPNDIKLPILIKPVDSNSGKGLSVCYDKASIAKGIKNALSHSASKRVLIEKFMQCDDLFIYFTIERGRLGIGAMADRYTMPTIGDLGRVCYKAQYPSKYLKKFESECLPKLQALIESVGINFGVLMISAFVDDGIFYFYDPGFRLQGEAPDIHVEHATSISHPRMLAKFALTGVGAFQSDVNPHDKYRPVEGVTLWILCKPGVIHHIEGVESLAAQPGVLRVVQRLEVGNEVTNLMVGTEGQVFLRCYISSLDKILQHSIMEFIKKRLVLLDVYNNNMLLDIRYDSNDS